MADLKLEKTRCGVGRCNYCQKPAVVMRWRRGQLLGKPTLQKIRACAEHEMCVGFVSMTESHPDWITVRSP